MVAAHGLSTTPASVLVLAVGAASAMREGRVDEAKAAASGCQDLLAQLDDSLAWLSAETRILVARVALGLGHVARARELLAEASRLARRTPDVVLFQRWFDDAWGQFDERAETTLAGIGSLTTAELRVLRFLPTHYPFHEIAQRLHVSSNTVKTHVHAVYRKLDASSRSEAVATATRAGLLGADFGCAGHPPPRQSPSHPSISMSYPIARASRGAAATTRAEPTIAAIVTSTSTISSSSAPDCKADSTAQRSDVVEPPAASSAASWTNANVSAGNARPDWGRGFRSRRRETSSTDLSAPSSPAAKPRSSCSAPVGFGRLIRSGCP